MMKQRGFTLVELMITLVIGAILITVAIPSFVTSLQNNRITAQANELITALNIARSEAVKRGDSVSICASSDSATCTGAWSDGWIVFHDADDDGDLDAADDTIIQVWDALTGSATLAGAGTSLTYDRLGATNQVFVFTLNIPDCVGDQRRIISVNNAGKANVTRAACL